MNGLPAQGGRGDDGSRAGGRAGKARRGMNATPDRPTLVAVRDHIKGRRPFGSWAAGFSIRRRSRGVPPRVIAQVAASVGHAADLAPVERPVGVEPELEAHEPELVEFVELENP